MEKNQINKSLNNIKLVKTMSIFDNIFKNCFGYLLTIPFISQLVLFFFMHFLGIFLTSITMVSDSTIYLVFLEKITPDIFIIYTKPEIRFFLTCTD